MRAIPEPKTPVPKSVRNRAKQVIGSIEACGWDLPFRGIYEHALKFGQSDGLFDRLRDALGRRVTGWEMEPGRTQSEVLALLREVGE